MTTQDRLIKMLIACGFAAQQAEQVLELAKPKLNELAGGYAITFHANENQYPEMMYSLWFETIRPTALDWLNQNQPNAWFKGVFEKG
jgi:hypothetical protein